MIVRAKTKLLIQLRAHGFTLLEAIVGLLLSAVLVSLLLPLIGSSIEGSRRAVLGLSEPQLLRNQMDTITAIYRTSYPDDLGGLANHIAQGAGPSTYVLVDSSWVTFDAQGNEITPSDSEENILRITLGNTGGDRLTSYFFQSMEQ